MPLPCLMVVLLIGGNNGESPYIGLHVIMGSSSFITNSSTFPWDHSMHTSKMSVAVDLLVGLAANPGTEQNGDSWCPYVITFVNREAADEWWRMISTPPSPYAKNVERISPEFYIQSEPHSPNVSTFFSCTALPDARRFHKKMFFTSLYNASYSRFPTTFNAIAFTDHISGGW